MPDYLGLITSEHRDKPKFRAMVEAVSGAFADCADLAASIPALFDIDQAVGEQLDIVGQWVGQSRLIPNVLLVQFFGYSDQPAALPYGEEGNPSIGGRFYDEGEPASGTTVLADAEYRTILKAKIVRNQSKGLTQDFIRSLRYVFDAPALIDDPGIMAIGIAIGRPVTLTERAIISATDILPRPAGVRIAWRGFYNSAGFLGFDGQPGAITFAEEGQTGTLGFLMEEF